MSHLLLSGAAAVPKSASCPTSNIILLRVAGINKVCQSPGADMRKLKR